MLASTAVPRGTRLSAAQRLTVISYNLLAPLYVRPIDERTGSVQAFAAFAWAEPFEEVLAWEARQPRLLAELRASEADVICLQEVQFERQTATDDKEEAYALPSWLQLDGYLPCIPGQRPLREMATRNERVLRSRTPVGNALLYRTDRLEPVGSDESAAKSKPGGKSEQSTTRVGVCVRGRAGSGLASLGKLALFSLHLDATSEDRRVKALAKCLETARLSYGTRNVLIAGDMNTELLKGSCTEAMLRKDGETPSEAEMEKECASALRIAADDPSEDDADAEASAATAAAAAEVGGGTAARPTEEQLAAWRELYLSARAAPSQTRIELERVPTGATRAAFAPGQTSGPCASWRLDHILYTPRALSLGEYWQTLEAHPEAEAAGLPNMECPSDHWPVAASFGPLPVPVMGEEARTALLARVDAMLSAQAAERSELAAVLDKEVSELEVAAKAAAPPSEATADTAAEEEPAGGRKRKKEKKKKGGPPSAEMQALLRSRRERERGLRTDQRASRQELLDSLSEMEKDALEEAKIELVDP